MRLTKEELEKIKNKYDVDILWSWSRVSAWHTSKYEWFLRYVQHIEPDRTDCIYGQEGSYSHDIIEKFYNKEIQYDDMLTEFEDSWNMSRNVLGLKFNRNDATKDESIAEKYHENLKLFFQNHQPLNHNLHTEHFALIHVGNNILQGYIDAWYQDNENDIHIIDWKSSSIYTGNTLTEKSGQLVCYAMYFMQNGVPIEKIHLYFNFLKYCTITYEQANGKIKSMNVERRLLGEKLQSPCKMWLKKFGYDVDEYLPTVLDTMDIKCLPQEVKDKITISDCFVEVPCTMEQIEYWQNYINETINEIESSVIDYEVFDNEEAFYDSIDDVTKESFYYATLSEYSANLNPCYKKYLDKMENGIDFLS